MKKLFTLVVLSLLFITVHAQEKKEVIRLSEPVLVTEEFEVFGAEPGEITEAKSLESTIKQLASNDQKVVVKTRIAKVCQKKGCFFVAQEGNTSARITFKDYGFFIPTDSQGKEVTIVGKLSKKVISEESAKHFAEDTGDDAAAIKGEQVEYSIVATSIVIQKETGK